MHAVVDVTAGVRVAIDVLSGPGGVVFPTPGYNAQHGLAGVTGRAEHLLEVPASADRAPRSTSTGWTGSSPRVRRPCC